MGTEDWCLFCRTPFNPGETGFGSLFVRDDPQSNKWGPSSKVSSSGSRALSWGFVFDVSETPSLQTPCPMVLVVLRSWISSGISVFDVVEGCPQAVPCFPRDILCASVYGREDVLPVSDPYVRWSGTALAVRPLEMLTAGCDTLTGQSSFRSCPPHLPSPMELPKSGAWAVEQS